MTLIHLLKENAQVIGAMRKVIVCIERMRRQHLKLTLMALHINRTRILDQPLKDRAPIRADLLKHLTPKMLPNQRLK